MITEDYISFETAKLLKEKGFNPIYCGMYYSIETGKRTTELLTSLVSCPTLQMAMKWIREVHNWTICISPYWPEGDMRNKLTWYYDIHSLIDNRSFRESSYTDNYTEACEAAIKYSLENLI